MNILNSVWHGESWVKLVLVIVGIGVCIAIAVGLFRASLTLLRMTVELLRAAFGIVNERAASFTVALVCDVARLLKRVLLIVGWHASRPVIRIWDKACEAVVNYLDRALSQIERDKTRKKADTHGRAEDRARGHNDDQRKQEKHSSEDFSKQAHETYEVPRNFAEACLLFALPVTGEFTKAALNAAYRQRIHKAHPDKDGRNDLATQLNVARDLIREHKGWA